MLYLSSTYYGFSAAAAVAARQAHPPLLHHRQRFPPVGVDTSFPYVLAGTSVTFRDTITGTGAFTAGVAWFVNGVPGGDAISGTIDGQGYYTAPAIIPPVSPVTIKATALGDSTKSASTTVSVFTLAFSPTNPVVDYGHPQQFKAIVTGVSNPLVYWVAQYGKFSSDGLYTPP